MIGFTPELNQMELKTTNNKNDIKNNTQNNLLNESDDASKLWKQYQIQRNKKKLGTCILFSFVIVIVVILVIIGLYIVLSTNDPLNSL